MQNRLAAPTNSSVTMANALMRVSDAIELLSAVTEAMKRTAVSFLIWHEQFSFLKLT